MSGNHDDSALIGVDVGTSVIKAILFDLDGNEIEHSSAATQLLHRRPSWVECDMDGVLGAVVESLRIVVAESQWRGLTVLAIGITGQGDGTWLIDHHNRPVRAAITWLDGRSSEYLDGFEREHVSRKVFERTWSVLSTSNQAVQLRWLKDHEPDSLRRAKAAVRAKDWVFLALTGQLSTDSTDASHTYFNIHEGRYDREILRILGIDELWPLLPEAYAPSENKASLLPELAADIGLEHPIPVVAGPIDVVASDLGVGATHPGDACTVLGTASIHQIVTRPFSSTPLQMGYILRHASPDLWITTLPTMTGTLNTEWLISNFYPAGGAGKTARGADSWKALEDAVRAVPFGSNGVMYHPFIDPAGERAPFVQYSARAQFTGLSLRHDKASLARAVYEGVVLSALDCYTRLSPDIKRLKLTGGGCRSTIWPEMFADALGCPVEIVDGNEAGAKGAAINAGVALGIYPSYEEAAARTVKISREISPRKEMRARYLRLLELYREVYSSMRPIWDDFYSFFSDLEGEQLPPSTS